MIDAALHERLHPFILVYSIKNNNIGSSYFGVGKYCSKIIGGGRGGRAKMERVSDLKSRVHG